MNKAERFIKKHLDEAELRLLAQYDRWLKTIFAHIPMGATEEQIHQYHLPQPALLSHILFRHVSEMFHSGMAHGDVEAKEIRDKHKLKLAQLPFLESMGEIRPEQAIAVLRKRQIVLAGDVESDIATKIKAILLRFLTGESVSDTNKAVSDLLEHNKNRASLIVTTETTYAYNHGRLVTYRENKVDYVRFSAILDGRTSTICRSRNGLIMAMDDPELAANTPPLHGRCRSVLTPIYSRYEPELIGSKQTDWSDVVPLPSGWRTK